MATATMSSNKDLDISEIQSIIIKGENEANVILIKMPKQYENIDLTTKRIVLKVLNPVGEYYEEILSKRVEEDNLIAIWEVKNAITSRAGELKITISIEDGQGFVLNSRQASINVLQSTNTTESFTTIETLDQYLAEIRNQASKAKDSETKATEAKNELQSSIVDNLIDGGSKKILSAEQGKVLNTRVDNIVAESGNSNTEIVDARNSPERNTIYPTLKGRLDAVDGDIVKSKYSAPATATAPIISLPSTAVKGKLEGSLKGNTLYNAITNGDFANGTTGWTPSSATLTVTNKVLSVTGNGASSTPFVYQNTNLIAKEGFKFFLFARAKIKNANCTSLRLEAIGTGGGGAVVAMGIPNPVENTTYDLLGVITLPINASGVVRFRVVSQYPDAATANGKTMEVDGNVGVFAIPLSGTSYTDWTADQLNNLISGYWEGLGNSKPSRTKVTGKNLFDKNKAVDGYYITSTGVITPLSGTFLTGKIPCKPLTTYVSNRGSTAYWNFYDDNETKISTTSTALIAVTTPANAYFLETYSSDSTKSKDVFQIELGTTATAYEPYTETELFAPVELGSVPNGIQDEFTFDGRFIQRIKEYALQTGDITTLYTGWTNVDSVSIKKPLDFVAYGNVKTSLGTMLMDSYGQFSGSADSLDNINKFRLDGNNTSIELIIPKNIYGNLAAAQTALAGTKIRYQLAAPIETQYPASNLIAEPSGTIYVDNIVNIVKPYATNITVDVKIKNLISVTKVDGETRVPVLLSLVNVASDGMSLTILNASSGDMYELEYETFGATLPSLEYSYPSNLNAQVQGNTEALKSTDKTLQDFLAYQNAVNAQVDLRLVLLERK